MTKMKTLLFALFAIFITSFAVQAQTARLQVIHNAADPAASVVDIYLNGSKLLDDFAFRAATPFIDAPANQELTIGVAPGTSSSAADIIATFKVTLMEGKKYIAVANGVLSPSSFAPNPDGKNTAFNLFVKADAQEAAMTSGNVEFAVMHGSTDAPTVDIVARGVATLVDNAPYTAITNYISVPAADYTLDIKDASGTVTVATFSAPLSGLANGAAFVFASGFFTPSANQNGAGFGVFAALPDGNVIALPAVTTARLQVIHNAADPAADSVDIYLNGAKLLDNFAFRAATPFIDAPANQNIVVGVAPKSSASVSDVIASFTFNLLAGEKYIAVANGVLDPTSFAPNPDGISTAFNIFVKTMAQEEAMIPGNVEFAVMHGSTDAPTVDIVARGVATLVNDAPYTAITDYISVPAADYTIDIKDASGTVTVATFSAPLSGLANGAAFVLASGFLNPAANQNGKAFGVLAVLPDGTVIQLPAITTARLQVIHNAADPAAEKVDVYLNGAKLLDDFAFRAATPFIDAPANQNFVVGIAPSTSSSASDVIANFTFNLLAGEKYIAIADGVLNPASFAPNPDGKNTAFNIFVKTMAQESAKVSGNVEFAVMHGSTDAPTVDIVARGVATLVNDAPYTAITDYISVPAADYTIDIKDASGTVTVATFTAPLSGLANGAAFVLASGFLNPAANQNGKAFGVLAVLPDGTVIQLPAITTARLQVIHNAADPAAKKVDIYLNGTKLLDDFAFRTATPFIDAPANQDFEIGIAPGTSVSASDIIAKFNFRLLAGETYIAIANGVLDPNQFVPNPDGRNIAFSIWVKELAREKGTGSNVDFIIVHGATDVDAVKVMVKNGPTLVESAAYGDITDYISVPAAAYDIRLIRNRDGATLGAFDVNLTGLAGSSAVVLASGFRKETGNQGGDPFQLIGVLANGQVVVFNDPPTSVRALSNSVTPTQFELKQNYPNPFNPTTTITFSIPSSEFVKLSVYNALGQEVATLVNQKLNAGQYSLLFDASNLVSGVYYYRIEAGNFTSTKRLVLLR